MRLILDRNYCSNPQAPTPACFFFLSRSVCFFLSTVSLNPSSTLHWLHLFFTFLLSFLMMGNSCSSWSCIFYFPQPFYLFFTSLIPPFLLTASVALSPPLLPLLFDSSLALVPSPLPLSSPLLILPSSPYQHSFLLVSSSSPCLHPCVRPTSSRSWVLWY